MRQSSSGRTEYSEAKRSRLILYAGWIALAGNLLLAVLKLVTGIAGNSLAVLGDGIDSATDVVIAGITLIISRIILLPSDAEHPWGHGRAETTATMVLAFLIFYAGMQLSVSAVKSLYFYFTGQVQLNTPGLPVIIATCISIAGKLILAGTQFYFARIAVSPMLRANAQNMLTDSIISVSVLAGLAAAKIFNQPMFDSIIAGLVGLWVVKNAVKIFLQMNLELMDGTHNKDLYEKLFTAIRQVPGVSNPHRARIRKIASRWDIDIDIEVDANLSVHEAHEIAGQVEEAVRSTIPDVYDIMVHIEPAGHMSHHPKEQFGLNESNI